MKININNLNTEIDKIKGLPNVLQTEKINVKKILPYYKASDITKNAIDTYIKSVNLFLQTSKTPANKKTLPKKAIKKKTTVARKKPIAKKRLAPKKVIKKKTAVARKKPAVTRKTNIKKVSSFSPDMLVLRRFRMLFSPNRKKRTSLAEIELFLKHIQKNILAEKLRKRDTYATQITRIQKTLVNDLNAKKVSKHPSLYKEIAEIVSKIKVDKFVKASNSYINNKDEELYKKRLSRLMLKPKQKIKKKEVSSKQTPLSLTGVVSASELSSHKFKVFDFEEYKAVFGDVSLPVQAMVSGLPGSGKTTFFIDVGAFLSRKKKRVLFVSNEEGMGATIQKKLSEVNYNSSNFYVSHEIPEDWISYDVVILDSVNNLRISPLEFDRMKKEAKLYNVSIFSIFKATKNGNFKGDSDYEHDVDISLTAENGTIKVKKNRFGGMGSYQIFNNNGEF